MPVRTVLLPLDGTQSNANLAQLLRTHINPEGVRIVLLRAALLGSVDDVFNNEDLNDNSQSLTGADFSNGNALPDAQTDPVRYEMLCQLQDELSAQVESLRSAGYTVIGEIRFGAIAKHISEYVQTKPVSMVAVLAQNPEYSSEIHADVLVDNIRRDVHVPVLVIRLSEGTLPGQ